LPVSAKELLRHGTSELLKETPFTDGKRNGVVKMYYQTGRLKVEYPYTDGKKNGVSKEYYATGGLKREVVFKEDIADSGYNYEEDGRKREMTNAHLH
jgi:antitoxin component YwqK of YwqJK toxin-antitoxin module